jgi:hypothetical protein
MSKRNKKAVQDVVVDQITEQTPDAPLDPIITKAIEDANKKAEQAGKEDDVKKPEEKPLPAVKVYDNLQQIEQVVTTQDGGKRAYARKLLGAMTKGQVVLGSELRRATGLTGPNWQGFLISLSEKEYRVGKVNGWVTITKLATK